MSPGVNPRPSLNAAGELEVDHITPRGAGGEPPALIERSKTASVGGARRSVAGGEPPALIERTRRVSSLGPRSECRRG